MNDYERCLNCGHAVMLHDSHDDCTYEYGSDDIIGYCRCPGLVTETQVRLDGVTKP